MLENEITFLITVAAPSAHNCFWWCVIKIKRAPFAAVESIRDELLKPLDYAVMAERRMEKQRESFAETQRNGTNDSKRERKKKTPTTELRVNSPRR